MIDIKPTRDNWRQFCTVPPLTDAELETWRELADAIREDDTLLTELMGATEAEKAAQSEAANTRDPGDWSDLVASVDAARRLQRAEVEWWRGRNRLTR